jgi:hydrogenase maturation factor
LLTDAQTSGGLLICVPRKHADATLRCIKRYRPPCTAVIGHIVRSAKPTIRVKA